MTSYVIYRVSGRDLIFEGYSTAETPETALNSYASKNKLSKKLLNAKYILIPTGEIFTQYNITLQK